MKTLALIKLIFFVLAIIFIFFNWKLALILFLIASIVHIIPLGPNPLLTIITGYLIIGGIIYLFIDWKIGITLIIIGFLVAKFRIYGNKCNYDFYEKNKNSDSDEKKIFTAPNSMVIDTNEQTKNIKMADKNQRVFAAFITDTEKYWIYLVNPTNKRYKKVVTLTGANMADDEGVIETTKSMKIQGVLDPQASILLEHTNMWGWGDDSIWFHIDLYSDENAIPEMLIFMPQKYYRNSSEVMLLVLNKMGRVNELRLRDKQVTIDEEIKTMNMEGAYHKFGDLKS